MKVSLRSKYIQDICNPNSYSQYLDVPINIKKFAFNNICNYPYFKKEKGWIRFEIVILN